MDDVLWAWARYLAGEFRPALDAKYRRRLDQMEAGPAGIPLGEILAGLPADDPATGAALSALVEATAEVEAGLIRNPTDLAARVRRAQDEGLLPATIAGRPLITKEQATLAAIDDALDQLDPPSAPLSDEAQAILAARARVATVREALGALPWIEEVVVEAGEVADYVDIQPEARSMDDVLDVYEALAGLEGLIYIPWLAEGFRNHLETPSPQPDFVVLEVPPTDTWVVRPGPPDPNLGGLGWNDEP